MAEMSLFAQLLGSDYRLLPAAVRAVHDSEGTLLLAGRSEVERRPGPLSWAVCALMGLPERGREVVVTVEVIRRDGSEIWKRRFGNRRYQSTLSPRPAEQEGWVVEHFRPFQFAFALRAEPDRLVLDLREWRFLGLRMPNFLRPRCIAEEREEKGRFTFDIPLDLPIFGRILRYKGWLTMVEGEWGE